MDSNDINASQLDDEFGNFGTLEEEELYPQSEPATHQERADQAVKNALLESRTWVLANGQRKKIHNVSDQHMMVWNDLTSDGRAGSFQVISLLWVLLQAPKQIIKIGCLNIPTIRLKVMEFAAAEEIKGERFEELEDCLTEMIKETEVVQVKPDDDEVEGKT